MMARCSAPPASSRNSTTSQSSCASMATWASLTRRRLRSPRAGARCTSAADTDSSWAAVSCAAAATGDSTTSNAGISRPFLASARAASEICCCAVDCGETDSDAVGIGWPEAGVTAASSSNASSDTPTGSATDTAEPGRADCNSPRVKARSAVSSSCNGAPHEAIQASRPAFSVSTAATRLKATASAGPLRQMARPCANSVCARSTRTAACSSSGLLCTGGRCSR